MNSLSVAPLIVILLLLLSAFCLVFFKRPQKISLVVFSIMTLILWTHAFIFVSKDPYFIQVGHHALPYGIALRVSALEIFVGLLLMTVSTIVIAHSISSLKREIGEAKEKLFFILIHILMAALIGTVYTQDLFNGYVFIEVSTLAACGIIVVKNKADNIKAAMKYLILSSLGSGLVLMGIAYLYALTGHLDMNYVHESLVNLAGTKERMVLISMVLFMMGTGIKSALFPLHVWLPDAHTAAPAPSSALLSGLVIKAPAVYFIKVCLLVYGLEMIGNTAVFSVLLMLSGVGMIAGSLLARRQKLIKRMIAYSSVAQIGYVFFGLGLGTSMGAAVAVYHILGHGLTKSALFLVAGTFIDKTGKKDISSLNGIGRVLPFPLAVFTICGLSMIGIPLLPGFISKWNLALSAIEAGKMALLSVILISSILNATYYFPVIINGFFHESAPPDINDHLVPKWPLSILMFLLILAGLYSGRIIDLLMKAMG